MRQWMRKAMTITLAMTLAGCGTTPQGTSVTDTATEAEEVRALSWSEEAWSLGAAGIKKEETVRGKADAAGHVRELTVTDVLRLPQDYSGEMIPDLSMLSDLRNSEGDEEFVRREDGSILWENHQADITYEGTAEGELPVGIHVTYYLDGEEISPEKLAGKSGHVIIRFDYENHLRMQVKTTMADLEAVDFDEDEELSDTEDYKAPMREVEVETAVPMIAVTALLLDDHFEHVEVTNGEQLEMGGRSMVVGYALPGLTETLRLTDWETTKEVEIPEYVELAADVTDFSLEFTATVFGTEILKDLEEEDLTDLEDMSAAMTLLDKAAGALADGTGELTDGAVELRDAVKSYLNGTAKVESGIRSLRKGLDTIDQGLASLDLSSGGGSSSQLRSVMEGMGADVQSISDGLRAVETYYSDVKTAKSAIDAIDTSEMSEEGRRSVEKAANALAGIREPDLTFAATARKDLQKKFETLTTALSATAESLSGMETQMGTLKSGISELAKGAGELENGMKKLTGYNSDLKKGMNRLVEGCEELEKGAESFHKNGVKKLSEKTGEDLVRLLSRVRAMKAVDGSFVNYAGIHPDMDGSVSFLIETDEI